MSPQSPNENGWLCANARVEKITVIERTTITPKTFHAQPAAVRGRTWFLMPTLLPPSGWRSHFRLEFRVAALPPRRHVVFESLEQSRSAIWQARGLALARRVKR